MVVVAFELAPALLLDAVPDVSVVEALGPTGLGSGSPLLHASAQVESVESDKTQVEML